MIQFVKMPSIGDETVFAAALFIVFYIGIYFRNQDPR